MGGNRETLQRYGLAVVSHLLLVLAWYLFIELGHVPKFVMSETRDLLRREIKALAFDAKGLITRRIRTSVPGR